ncbi:MAG TPA: SRPBCC family protein [Acidimicrobiales bacterium]|nr:SRPBCC family protein [Acidimicrobiales bacterium]
MTATVGREGAMSGDGRTGEASVVIAAEPEVLWAMVTDLPRMGEWSPENKGGEWVGDATGPAVGARFKGRNQRGKSRWSTTVTITEAEPGRSFAFRASGKPATVWRYGFEPAEGGTRVTESFAMDKPLGALNRLITKVTTGVDDRRADMEEGVRTTLANLKAAAEKSA